MDKIFQKLVNNNFSELAGLRVDSSIPVPEHLVNEIIEAALQGNKNINYCRVSISGQNLVSVNLKTPLWPWPLNFKLRLFRSVDFARSPKIRASLESNVLLGKLGSLFNALPAGINVYDGQVAVDIQSFLSTPEQKRMLDLVKSVEVRTEQARVILDVRIKVEDNGG